MQLNRIFAVVLRQYFLLRGSMVRIVPMFVWAAIDIVLWGFITKYLGTITAATGTFVPGFMSAILFWHYLIRVTQGTSMAFMEDMWSRNFLNLFASPITVGEYVIGLVITSLLTSLIGLVVMILIATSAFGVSLLAYGAVLIPLAFVLFLFAISLGIFGCSILLWRGPAAEWFIWPIPAILSPFACVFYPLSVLPHWMQWIAHLMPPMYVFESMRNVITGGQADISMLFIGLALSALFVLFACLTYARVFHHAVCTGLIARYSAENIG